MNQDQFVNKLKSYMPEPACIIAYRWFKSFPTKLKITKPRKTKLGDFRPQTTNGTSQISVNGDLNPYSFLITFTHEMAHLIDYSKRKSLRDPHGPTWKLEYQKLLIELVENEIFPIELRAEVISHINRPKAASCSDPKLLRALRAYDSERIVTLNEIPIGATFRTSSTRSFIKGELRRTRYRCKEVDSNRFYLIHGESQIELI